VAAPTPPPATPKPVTIRFASPGALSDAGVYIGIEKGYFKELAVDVKVETVQSAASAIAPLAAGDLEIAGGVLSTALLNAIDRGVAMKVVGTKGGAIKGFDASQFIIRKDLIDSGQVKEVKDLKGKKMALANVQSGAESEASNFLKQGGLTIKDVELVVMGYPDMLPAFANKAIDVSIQNEPLLTTSIEQKLAVKWPPGALSTAYGGEYQVATLIVSEAFAKNVDAARRFMVGYVRGLRDYNDAFIKGKDKDGIIAILIKYTAQKDPAVYAKMEMSYLNPDGKMHLASMKMDFDYFKQMGYYTGKLEFQSIVDTQFIDYALQQLGPYK
jgi:NitT/TauT family transport system substrate-binding protein